METQANYYTIKKRQLTDLSQVIYYYMIIVVEFKFIFWILLMNFSEQGRENKEVNCKGRNEELNYVQCEEELFLIMVKSVRISVAERICFSKCDFFCHKNPITSFFMLSLDANIIHHPFKVLFGCVNMILKFKIMT